MGVYFTRPWTPFSPRVVNIEIRVRGVGDRELFRSMGVYFTNTGIDSCFACVEWVLVMFGRSLPPQPLEHVLV